MPLWVYVTLFHTYESQLVMVNSVSYVGYMTAVTLLKGLSQLVVPLTALALKTVVPVMLTGKGEPEPR